MKIKLSDNEDNKNLELIEYSNKLEDRIDKAIEYISYLRDKIKYEDTKIIDIQMKRLLDILKGVDKE